MAQWPTSVSTDAQLYIAVNALQTTLSGNIDNAVTTITLTSTTGFPTAGGITIDSEVIFYTNISGAQLTGCVRGSDGTTAASHSSGVNVGATVIAFHHNGLKNEIIAIETDLNARFGFGSTAIAVPSGVSTTINSTAGLAITPTTNQLVLGSTRTVTINAPTPATASRIYTLPDIGSAATVAYLEGIQTFSGSKTFSAALTLSNGSAGTPSLNFGDAGTGWYRSTANRVALATNTVKSIEFYPVGSADATDYTILYLNAGGGSSVASEILARTTTGVSTSTTQILNMDVNSYMCQVYGADGSGNDFYDVVNTSYYSGATVNVTSTATSRGTPAGRTYTHGSNGVLSLAMASGTYNIRVTAYGIGNR